MAPLRDIIRNLSDFDLEKSPKVKSEGPIGYPYGFLLSKLLFEL